MYSTEKNSRYESTERHASRLLPIPQLRLVLQVPLRIELDPFPPQQLDLLARFLPLARLTRTRSLGLTLTRPFAAEPADEERRGDDPVAGDVGCEGVGAEGGADCAKGVSEGRKVRGRRRTCARRGREKSCELAVGRDAAFRDGQEEIVELCASSKNARNEQLTVSSRPSERNSEAKSRAPSTGMPSPSPPPCAHLLVTQDERKPACLPQRAGTAEGPSQERTSPLPPPQPL